MNNIKISYIDLENTSFTASSENALYPATNLTDYESDAIWKSASLSLHDITMDLLEEKDCNHIIINNHNLMKIGAYNNNFALFACNNVSFTGSYTALTIASNINNNSTIFSSFNTLKARYWRLEFTPLGSYFITYPYIGNIFVGEYLESTVPYNTKYKSDDAEYITNEVTMLDGRISTCAIQLGRYTYDFVFDTQDNTFMHDYKLFITTVEGKRYPFFFIDVDNKIRYVNLSNDYNPIKVHRYGLNSLDSFLMKEHKGSR